MIGRHRHVLPIAVAAVLVVAGGLYAQGPGFGRGSGRGPGGPGVGLPLRELGLTEAQREQVRQLSRQHREQVRPLLERLRAADAARRAAIEAVPVDPARVRAAMQELAEIQTELAIQQAQLHSDIVGLLTPEQRVKADTLRAERQARMQQRRERMRNRVQQARPPA